MLVFSDKEEMWFNFVAHQNRRAWCLKLIHNILIVGTRRPHGFNFSVYDLEQRGKTVRTMCMPVEGSLIIHRKTPGLGSAMRLAPVITTNMIYFIAVSERRPDYEFDLGDVVKCLELRKTDHESDNGLTCVT